MGFGKVLIFLGPPGAGKGTQAAKLAATLHIPHISTGDLFRKIAQNPTTDIEHKIKATMDAGQLISDAMTIELVTTRLAQADCQNGCILDGFPRTVAQADALADILAAHAWPWQAILFAVPDDVLIARKAGRLYAPQSQQVYHETFNPPRTPGQCDISGETLIKREDDQPEITKKRLDVYHSQTMPLVAYYEQRQALITLDGTPDMATVFAALTQAIGVPH